METSAAHSAAKVIPATSGCRPTITCGRASAALTSGNIAFATIPRKAANTPTGSMIMPPQTKPFLAVSASLAPKEICKILCRDRFTVIKVKHQLAMVTGPTPSIKLNQGTFAGSAAAKLSILPILLNWMTVAIKIPT